MEYKVKVSDTRERDLSKVFRKLNSLSVKCSKVLIDTLSGENKDYSKKQMLSAKYILQILTPFKDNNGLMGDSIKDLVV